MKKLTAFFLGIAVLLSFFVSPYTVKAAPTTPAPDSHSLYKVSFQKKDNNPFYYLTVQVYDPGSGTYLRTHFKQVLVNQTIPVRDRASIQNADKYDITTGMDAVGTTDMQYFGDFPTLIVKHDGATSRQLLLVVVSDYDENGATGEYYIPPLFQAKIQYPYVAAAFNKLKDDLVSGTVVTITQQNTENPDDWMGGQNFPVYISDGNPPYIEIPRAGISFPKLKLTLTYVVGPAGRLNFDNNYFYFCVTEKDGIATSDYSNFCLRVDMNGDVVVVSDVHAVENPNDDDKYDDSKIKVRLLSLDLNTQDNTYLNLIINRVYNGYNSANSECGITTSYPNKANPLYSKVDRGSPGSGGQLRRCLNVSSGGWLDHWHVGFNKSYAFDTTGVTDQASGCGCSLTNTSGSFDKAIKGAMCSILCWLYDIGYNLNVSANKWLQDSLGTITGN